MFLQKSVKSQEMVSFSTALHTSLINMLEESNKIETISVLESPWGHKTCPQNNNNNKGKN